MSRTSDSFDEYGNYGENNGPLPPRVENDREDIRPMTEEERQRAKEREAANQASVDESEPFSIVVDTVTDHEDGSAGITVTMGDKARDSVIELGLQFIFTCAAAKMDIQDALDGILAIVQNAGEQTDKNLYNVGYDVGFEDGFKEAQGRVEAKLKKAMEMALEGCPYRYGTDSYNEWWNNFRTTLAAMSETHKLKGDSDG